MDSLNQSESMMVGVWLLSLLVTVYSDLLNFCVCVGTFQSTLGSERVFGQEDLTVVLVSNVGAVGRRIVHPT